MATDLQTAQTTLDAAQKQALDIQSSLNANDLVDSPNPNLGVTDNVAVDNIAGDTINTAVTAQQQIDAADKLAQEKIDAEREDLDTTVGTTEDKSTTQTLIDMLGGKGAPEVDKAGAELEAQEGVGFQKKSDDVLAQDAIVSTLNAELTGDKTVYDETVAAIRDRGGERSYVNSEVARETRVYNTNRARKLATLGVEYAKSLSLQGKLDSAQDMIDKAVENYVYDKTYEIARFDKVNELLFDWKMSLDSKDQALLDQARTDLIKERDDLKVEKREIGMLMMNNPKAGITIDDTLEEAMAKIARYEGSQPEKGNWQTMESNGKLYRVNPDTGAVEMIGDLGNIEADINSSIAEIEVMVEEGASREDLLSALEVRRTTTINSLGQDGYDQILAAIDRLLPEKEKTVTTPTTVGKASGTFLGEAPGNIWKGIGDFTTGVSAFNKSFWKGILNK